MSKNDPRILIVDDDNVSLHLLSNVFGDGYAVRCARSGEEALDAVGAYQPDIILLDIVMRGIQGIDVCRRLKACRETAAIPVVFISSREDPETEIEGLKAGGIDFITKPFHPAVVRMRIGNYVELKRTRDGLEQLSVTDQLTGLYNRRYFDRMLVGEVKRISRSRDTVSLLMMDVDDFKRYNDHNGHLAGDECLKIVAQTIRLSFRRVGDLVARYGGEEFAVLLPSTCLAPACMLAETARRRVEELRIAYTGLPENGAVTISVGAACMYPGPEADPQRFLDAADRALYRAKAEGRNRVVAVE